MIKKIKKKIPLRKKKFLFRRIPPEVGREEEEVIRKSIKQQSQRRLKNCSLMSKNWTIAIGQQKRRKKHLLEEKVEVIEEIEMITKAGGEEINKVEGSREVEVTDKGKMEEAIKVEIIIEIMKVGAVIIEVEIEVEREVIDMVAEIAEEIEMVVDKTILEGTMMSKVITTEVEEETVVIEAEEEAILGIITIVIVRDHKPKLNK